MLSHDVGFGVTVMNFRVDLECVGKGDEVGKWRAWASVKKKNEVDS